MSIDSGWLFLLAAVLAAGSVLLYRASVTRKTRRDLVYSNIAFFRDAVASPSPLLRWLDVLGVVALVAFVFGVAGLHVRLPVPVHDGAVFICIDTSGSMVSADITPTRAAAALTAAKAFIDETPAGTRIGIIAFSGSAAIVVPLSSDKQAVIDGLANVPAPNGATAIGDALQLAASNLPPVRHRAVVLITDGVNNAGADPQIVAESLGIKRIPIYTIGIGTPNGDVIGGEQATIDEGALRSYAQASGGAYASAQTATQLRDALARLGRATTIASHPVALRVPLLACASLVAMIFVFGNLYTGRMA